MTIPTTKPQLTSFAPQFLVDDLARSMAYYQRLGFAFGEPWDGFYAIGRLDGLELHLREAPKDEAERRHRREHEHLDAAGGVDGIEAFYASAPRMAHGSSSRSRRRHGVRRTSMSRIPTAISSASAGDRPRDRHRGKSLCEGWKRNAQAPAIDFH